MRERFYICIDLKSFYASVECVERGLDPMTANLVVADPERSDKTICLAVSPSMKKLGVKSRCRVFEIPKGIDYIMAQPRMQKYIDYAAEIYGIYLRYISKDDIHVYSIDEAFIDVTPYLGIYGMTAKEMAVMLMEKVYGELGVRATCGIGTNLYLTKIALDITAKHAADYIGYLDEDMYRRTLWDYRPLTDFWRIGRGLSRKFEDMGIYTMGQLAHMDEDILYRKFGVDAELLIDHAWGRESVTMADIKTYRPGTRCLSSGQVLMRDYTFEEGRLILREMVEQLCLDMVAKKVAASSLTICVGYSNSLRLDAARGTAAMPFPTSSEGVVVRRTLDVYDRVVERDKLIRRFNISCNNVVPDSGNRQLSIFDDAQEDDPGRDRKIQETMLDIKSRYGKNAMFKGMDLEEAATAIERNSQIGGHKSGE